MSDKPFVRAAVVLAGAIAIPLVLAVAAHADVVDPSRPYAPAPPPKVKPSAPDTVPYLPDLRVAAPTSAKDVGPQPAGDLADARPAAAEPAAVVATDATPAPADPAMTPRPHPVPELVVSRAPAVSASRPDSAVPSRGSEPFGGPVTTAKKTGFPQQARAFLAGLASACKVGVQSGTGGPVLVLAVLGMAAALDRRWVFRARTATDEDAPDFLYAWDVIAPG